jgi:SAM-dependent methyltransferase
VRELPFDGEFDVVGAFDVPEHVSDDGRALAAIRQAVRLGGGVIVTVPQHRWIWSEADRFSGHHRRYRSRELEHKLSEAGLCVRYMTSFVTLLLPLIAGSRAWQSISRRPFDPARELGISDSLDKRLERVMNAESRLIRCGVRLPAGGSLLAIADPAIGMRGGFARRSLASPCRKPVLCPEGTARWPAKVDEGRRMRAFGINTGGSE